MDEDTINENDWIKWNLVASTVEDCCQVRLAVVDSLYGTDVGLEV